MKSSDSLLNLPDIRQAFNPYPIAVSADTPLVEVLELMGILVPRDDTKCTETLARERNLFTEDNEAKILNFSWDSNYVLVTEGLRLLGIFTGRDFIQVVASNHAIDPQTKIAELMTQPIVSLKLTNSANIFTPLLFFRQYQIRHLPIVDDREHLLGIITPANIIQALQFTNLFQSGTVREFMNNRLVCTNSTNSVQKAAQLMAEYELNCILITGIQENLNIISNSTGKPDLLPPLSIPVGVITERKILQAWALGMDLSQMPVSSVMRRLGNELSPEHSLFYAYQQMQADRMETLLVSERQGDNTIVRLGTITEMELLRSLEPVQIYKRLKRTQLSVCQLQTEKAELLRQRNAGLEKQVQQRTAELEAALAAVERQAKQAALIARIAQAMRGTFVLDDIMQIAADRLHEALNVSRCLIFRPDSDDRLGIRYVSEASSEGNSLIGLECNFYQKYHSQLVRGESLVFPRIGADEPPEIQLAVKNCNIRALIIVPLIYQDSYLGGISLNECRGEREWTAEEIAFVKAIADHCAIAIHQAELYQQVRTELQERQKAEVALRESKKLFQQLAENIQQVFFVRDVIRDELVYISPTFEKIWGYSREILSENTRAFLDAVHPDDRDRITTAVNWQVLSDPYDYEYRIIRPDGEIRWVRDRGFPLKNERGEVYRITGIVDDITERKLSEAALQEQQQFLRTVIDTNPNLIFVKDWNGKFTLVNQALANVYGKSVEELIGKTDADFNGNLVEVEQFLKADREVITTLQSKLIFEETVTNPNGISRYFQTIKTPMISADGIARHVLGVATDITQRKQAEKALQQSQQMLQTIVDNIPQYIFWKDKNSVYLGCNHNFARAAGFNNPEEIVGKIDYDLPWKKEEADWYRECDRRVMDTKTAEYHIMETQLQANNKQICVDTNKIPLYDADGNVIGILGTYEDITERKQAEEALRESQAILSGIFNNSYQFTALLALDGILLKANQTALHFGGIQAADAIGRPFWKIKWWQPSKATQKRLKNAIATAARGQFVRYEVEMLGADDRVITIDFSLKPILNEAGKPIQLIAEARDITARKQAEAKLQKLNEELELKVKERTQELQQLVNELANEITERQQAEKALQQSQEKLQAILDNSPTVIYVHDMENRYLLINDRYENLFHVKKEEVIGQSIYQYWSPEIADKFAASNHQVIAEGTAIKLEEVIPHEDGLHTYITVKFPLQDTNGATYAVCGISMDITERKRTEQALKNSEARFQKLVANVPGMIYQYVLSTDGSQEVTYASPSCRQIWELEPEVIQSDIEKCFAMIHPDDLHSIYQQTQASAQTLQPWQWEGRIIGSFVLTVLKIQEDARKVKRVFENYENF